MAASVLIPAYRPDDRLLALVKQLRATGRFERIVVVDDGSGPIYANLFAQVEAQPKVTVLHHGVNLGKGAALRTGLHHFIHYGYDETGIVTADADGQHLTADIVRVADRLERSPGCLVIGSRVFSGDVPLRSKFGNTLTSYIFWAVVGTRLTDTQSGLRGIPRDFAADLLRHKSDRYEFELEMLIHCRQARREIVSEPIATVYLEGNESSHFNPLRDSLKIYFVLLRFLLASVLTALIDYAVFVTACLLGGSIFAGQVAARLVAGTVNYAMAQRVVFLSNRRTSNTLWKYALFVAVLGLCSYGMISLILVWLPGYVLAAKVASELLLYAVNFLIQRDVIFRSEALAELDSAATPTKSFGRRRAA